MHPDDNIPLTGAWVNRARDSALDALAQQAADALRSAYQLDVSVRDLDSGRVRVVHIERFGSECPSKQYDIAINLQRDPVQGPPLLYGSLQQAQLALDESQFWVTVSIRGTHVSKENVVDPLREDVLTMATSIDDALRILREQAVVPVVLQAEVASRRTFAAGDLFG